MKNKEKLANELLEMYLQENFFGVNEAQRLINLLANGGNI